VQFGFSSLAPTLYSVFNTNGVLLLSSRWMTRNPLLKANLLNEYTAQIYRIRDIQKKHPVGDYQQGASLYSVG
jgi:formate dehydrogenase maturation protein FdhE